MPTHYPNSFTKIMNSNLFVKEFENRYAALTWKKITNSFGNLYEYLFHLPRIQNFLSYTKLCSE